MLRQARERLPRCTFVEGDLSTWMPEPRTDLLFGNAVFQWVSDHPKVLGRLLASLPPGGVLAVQMPDNTNEPALTLMEKVAASGPWTTAIVQAKAARNDLPRPEDYYDLLRPLCSYIDIWHTHYNHIIENHQASSNGSKARGCDHSSRRLMRRCARRLPPSISMRSGSLIRYVLTAGSC